jgi:hypothetical protein
MSSKLRVSCIEEVRVGFPGGSDLGAWHNFLKPARRGGSAWYVGNGPVLRFIPADEARKRAETHLLHGNSQNAISLQALLCAGL